MREELIGYLMGALDAESQATVEQQLQADPHLRSDLDALRRSFRVLQGPATEARLSDEVRVTSWVEPPMGLAERTCCFVFEQVDINPCQPAWGEKSPPEDGHVGSAREIKETLFRPAPEPSPPSTQWSMADAFVVAGVCITAALLFAPTLITSQIVAQRNLCAFRLRELGNALQVYSAAHQGDFPIVEARGPRAFAGVYAPTLVADNLLVDPTLILCPESCAADPKLPCFLPSLPQIDRASAAELYALRSTAGGNFAYALPYRNERGEIVSRKNLGESHTAVLGDLQPTLISKPAAGRHGGLGGNCLFQDSRVNYQKYFRLGMDDLYRNDRGMIEAGQSIQDQVLAPSSASP